MANDENHNTIHQAVFGYSNGHRMLRSTTPLSSVDEYDLAALSDLAPGVRISGSESYLSGSRLADGHYALVRTWLAREMPRPGCVWSHVLLVPNSAISSQVDLSCLLPHFRRPQDWASDDGFARPLEIRKRAVGSPAPDPRLVELALRAVYESSAVDLSEIDATEWERAVLAVWAQQWPSLRRTFVFRSVFSSHRLRGQRIGYADHPRSTGTPGKPDWVNAAVDDAVSRTVTPLQRFLWRYGKDIDGGDNVFADLVEAMTDETRLGPDVIGERIFSRFPSGQAETLKADLLGAGGKLSLVGQLSPRALLSLKESGVAGPTMDRSGP